MVNTGNLAEQLIKGVTIIVMMRSFQLSIVRVAIIAGMAQATPDISGTTLFPFKPNLRMTLSIRKTTRAIYPDSSRIEMKANRIAICGTKIKMPPIPGINPSVTNRVRGPSGNADESDELICANKLSIKSIGTVAHAKMD